MKHAKKAITLILTALAISCYATSTFASTPADDSAMESSTFASSDGEKENDRSEVTEYKYKRINGVLYKRLWSVTYNHWIDPTWTPA